MNLKRKEVMLTPTDLCWVLGEQILGPLEYYFAKALKQNGNNVSYFNIHNIYPSVWKRFNVYSHRLPRKFDNSIQKKYFRVINDKLIELYKKEKPSHIFIYNDCKVLPETMELFKRNGTKIIIFLGDDPNYLFPAKKTFLLTTMNADAVIVPDTGWIDGLKMLDIKKIIYSPVGTDADVFFTMKPTEEQFKKFGADIMFAGTGYFLNAWGIKRASILNELCNMDFRIYGDKYWNEIFPYFPDLKKHFINKSLTTKELNIACNCSKLYPVMVNSGVVNGVSTRIFDGIASGIFILAEYKKDFNILFKNDEVAFFKSKNELREKAVYYLKNEKEMKEHISRAQKTVKEKFTLNILVKNILEQI